MGGRGSTRWNDHDRAPLVEETPSIDVVALRQAGILAQPEATFDVVWSVAGRAVGVAQARLGREDGGRRNLLLNTAFDGVVEPFQVELEMVAHTPNWGGTRWFLLCPDADCGEQRLNLYLDSKGRRVACRECLGLTHRSVQRHDARLDQARRDPEGFAQSREHLHSTRSKLVTAFLSFDALEVRAKPRRGRGWGRRSMTSWKRVGQEVSWPKPA
jgi:hypothetical protein